VCIGNTINELLFGYTYSYDETGIGQLMHYVELMHSFFVEMDAPGLFVNQAFPFTRHLPILGSAYQRAHRNMQE
ncbi:Protein CYP-14A2, partial [Aphelenchoides avenae]